MDFSLRVTRPLRGFLKRRKWEFIRNSLKDPAASAAFLRSPFDLIVHLGAHLAQEYIFYESLGAKTVVWVEANPQIASQAIRNLKSRRTSHIYHVGAVSGVDAKDLELFEFTNGGASNSFHRALPALNAEWPDVHQLQSVIKVKANTLDQILSEHQIELEGYEKKLLILDLQGHEFVVLSSLTDTLLSAFEVVFIEVSLIDIYDGAARFDQIDSLMRSNNFVRLSSIPHRHGDVAYGKV